MKLADIRRLIAHGESEAIELKQTTAQLPRAAETICAFLNASGGTVLIGVTPEGRPVGQQVSDRTQQEIANTLRKFEPPAPVEIEFVKVPRSSNETIVLHVSPSGETVPFTYDGRPYQRIGTTTSTMPQEMIVTQLSNPPSEVTVRDDLYHLKRLGLIELQGHGRSAVWFLAKTLRD